MFNLTHKEIRRLQDPPANPLQGQSAVAIFTPLELHSLAPALLQVNVCAYTLGGYGYCAAAHLPSLPHYCVLLSMLCHALRSKACLQCVTSVAIKRNTPTILAILLQTKVTQSKLTNIHIDSLFNNFYL